MSLRLFQARAVALAFCILAPSTVALFSDGFAQFLVDNYGKDAADTINRPDLGVVGSFGGGDSPIGIELG